MNYKITVQDIVDPLTDDERSKVFDRLNEMDLRSIRNNGYLIVCCILEVIKDVTGAKDLEALYYSRKGYNSEESV